MESLDLDLIAKLADDRLYEDKLPYISGCIDPIYSVLEPRFPSSEIKIDENDSVRNFYLQECLSNERGVDVNELAVMKIRPAKSAGLAVGPSYGISQSPPLHVKSTSEVALPVIETIVMPEVSISCARSNPRDSTVTAASRLTSSYHAIIQQTTVEHTTTTRTDLTESPVYEDSRFKLKKPLDTLNTPNTTDTDHHAKLSISNPQLMSMATCTPPAIPTANTSKASESQEPQEEHKSFNSSSEIFPTPIDMEPVSDWTSFGDVQKSWNWSMLKEIEEK